jgi:gliding motility-associated-like protein
VISFSSGGCSSVTSNVVSVIVNPDPTITIPPLATQTICVGGSIPTPLTVAYTNGTGTPTYQWYLVGTTNQPVSGATSVNFTPTSFTTTGIYEYYVDITLSGSGCNVMSSAIAQINVIPDPIVNTQPISTSYCQNSPSITPLFVAASGGTGTYTFQWYSNTTNNNTGGTLIPSATADTYSPPVTSVGTFYYYCVVNQTGANCSVTSQVAVVDVNLQPTITSTNFGPQTVCVDGTTTAMSVSYINGTGTANYQWFINTTNSTTGGTAITGANLSSYTPPTTTAGTVYYYCVISFPTGGCSNITSNIATIVVHPDPSLSVQPLANQTICEGGTIPVALNVNYINGTGSASYQWYSVGSPNTPIAGAISSSYTPDAFTTAGTFEYFVELSLSGSGCNMVTSGLAQIVVIQDPVISIASASQNYCQFNSNVLPITSNVTGGTGTVSYQWYRNNVNSNSNGVLINGSTSPDYTPPVNTVGTVYYYCVITQSGSNCGNVSNVIPIQTYLPASITSLPFQTQALCIGGNVSSLNVTYINGIPGATYQWYNNTTNNPTGGTAIAGATTNTYAPGSSIAGNYYYYCIISFPNGSCSDLISSIANVQIYNDPVITVQPVDGLDVCAESLLSSPYSVQVSGGVGSFNVQWYDITNNILTTIPDANQLTYNPTPINVPGTYDYFANITYAASGCNAVNSDTISLVIYPLPHVNSIADFTICNVNTFTVNIGTDIPANYVWVGTDNPNVSGEVFLPQTSSVISNTLTNNSTSPQTVTYTITPTSWPEGCQGPDSTFIVTVMPDITMTFPSTLEICSGSSVNAILSANVPSIFSWFTSIDNPDVSGESITTNNGSIINDLLVNNSTSNQLVIYSVFPTSIDGNCPGPAQTIAVIVKPPLSLLNEDTVTICSGNAVNLNLVANTTVSFNWYANQNVPVTGESISVVSSNNISDILTNNSSSVQEVNYSVIGTSTVNGCSSPVFDVVVFVNPKPIVIPNSDLTYCNGVTAPLISISGNIPGTIYNWTNSNSAIGLSTTGVDTIPSFNTINNGISLIQGVVNVTPTYTNNGITCNGISDQFIITVNPTPSIYGLSDQIVCANSQTTNIPVFGPVSGAQYNWISSNPLIGSSITGSGNITPFTATNSTSNSISSDFTITPSYTNNNVTCYGADSIVNITILPIPVVNSITNQTVCNGDLTSQIIFSSNINTNVSFSWTNNNNTIGLASSGNGDIAPFTAVNNTYLPVSSNISVAGTYSSNTISCIGNPLLFSISINPTPIIDVVPDYTFCNNENSLIDFTSTGMNGATYNWVNDNSSTGIPTSGSGDINFIASNTSNTSISSNLTVTPVYLNNGVTCYGEPQIFVVTVNPVPTLDYIANQTVCENSTVTVNFTSALGIAGTEYNWTNSNTSIGLASTGIGNISFNAANASNGTLTSNITVTPTYINPISGNQCTGTPQVFQIIVNPTPVITPINNRNVCANSTVNPINFISDVSNTQFNWTNTNTSIGIGASGNGNIPSFVGTNNTNAPVTGNFNVIGTFTSNGLTCAGLSQNFSITIDPIPTVDIIADQTVCQNQLVTVNFTSSFGVVVTDYQWTNTNTNTGLAASGTGNISFNSSTVPGSVQTSVVTVVPSFTNTLTGNQCPGTPQNFLITINPIPVVNAVASQTLCNGSNSTAVVFTSNVSNPSYTWTNSNSAIGIGTSGVGNIPSFVAQNSTSNVISGNLQVNISYTNNGVTCLGNNQLFSITVNPSPTVNPIANQSICNNDNTTQINFSGTVSGTTFSWVNSNTTIGLAASGNGNIPSFTGTNTSTTISVAQITVTPSATINGLTCSGTAQQFSITVNPTPTVAAITNATYCNNSSTNNVVFNGTISGTVFNWTSSNTAIGLPASGTGNITSFVATNSSPTPISSTITVIPVITNNGLTCTGNPQSFVITVNPTPIVSDPADQVVCSGASVNAVVFSSNTPSTVFSWQNDTPNIGLSASGTGNIASFVATNNLTATVTATITVTPSYTNNITCQGAPQSFTIAVNPRPTLVDPTDQVICSGTLTNTVVFSGNVVGTVFDWTNSNTTIGLAATGTGTINAFTGTNTSFTPSVGSVIVTPSYSNLGVTCIGNSQTFTITVNPIPNVVDPSDQVVCNSTSTAAIIFVGNVNGTVYTWTNSTNSIGLVNNGTGNINSFTAINATTLPVVSTLTVVSSFTNGGVTCTGNTENFTITVNPSANLTNPAVQICSNQLVNTNLTSSIPATFTWQAVNNNLVSGETFATVQNSSFINDLLINGTSLAQIVNYTINLTSTQYGCLSSATLPVTVNPLPNVQFIVSNPPPCNLTPVNFQNNTLGNNSYSWNFGDGANSTVQNPSHIYANFGSYNVVLTATNNVTGCVNSMDSLITILESPPIGFNVDIAVGCEVLDVTFTDTLNTPNTLLTWDFGDGQTSGQSGLVDHQYPDAGCYNVTLTITAANGCAISQTQEDMVCVYKQPIASFSTNDVNFLIDDSQVIFNNSSSFADTYFWDFGNGDTSVATNPIYNYNSIGEFIVTLYAYSIAGCYDSTRVTISVANDVLIYVPNTITVNADGVNDVFLPIIGEAFLKDTYHLKIFNRWGQIVFESYNSEIGWDATYTGPIKTIQQVQDGTYTWVITIKLNKNEDYRRFVGHVNVLNSR